jgi:hypothetical protein
MGGFSGANGLAGILEKLVGGRSALVGSDAQSLYTAGAADTGRGLDLSNEALGGMRSDLSGFQDQINQGGLPTDLLRQFAIDRGGLQDNATRQQRAFGAQLSQNFSRSGGQMSSSAMNEFGLENQQSSNEGLFNATNQLNMGQAQMALTNTNSLFDRISGIRNTILGAGQKSQQLGTDTQLGSLSIRLARNKAISDAIAKYVTMFHGGG